LLQQQQQQQQLQIHHSNFQTQKYITHNTSTSPPKPSHTEMSRRHSETQGRRREGTNARARLKTRQRRPTKGANGGARVVLIYPPGTNPKGGPADAFRPGYHSGCPLRLGIPYRPVLYFWYPIQLTTAWFCIFKNLITYFGDPIILQVGRLINL
jgi:hypothetical protein